MDGLEESQGATQEGVAWNRKPGILGPMAWYILDFR